MNTRGDGPHLWQSFGPHLTGAIVALVVILIFSDSVGSDLTVNAAAFILWIATYGVYYLVLRKLGRLHRVDTYGTAGKLRHLSNSHTGENKGDASHS